MGEYFKPWRRKVGVLTLLLACVAMVGWVRSLRTGDLFLWRSIGSTVQVVSSDVGRLSWSRLPQYESVVLEFEKSELDNFGLTRKTTNRFEFFELGKFETKFYSPPTTVGYRVPLHLLVNAAGIWVVPYWSIIIPLIALSAYLLLNKPRKSASMKITEPIAVEEK